MRFDMKYASQKLNRPRVSGLASRILLSAGAGIEQDRVSEGFLEHNRKFGWHIECLETKTTFSERTKIMTKRKTETTDWGSDLCNLNGLIEMAIYDLEEFENESGEDIKTHDGDQPLRRQLQEIQCLARKIHHELCGTLAAKLAAHELFSEREYHLMCASGCNFWSAKYLGISDVSDYDVFHACCYEDDRMRTYIMPTTKPPFEWVDKKTGVRKIKIRIGRAPEEIRLSDLNPKQRRFFEKHASHILSRFIQD